MSQQSPGATSRVVDSGIPTLPAVFNVLELSKHLEGVLPPQWGTLRDIEIRVLRHHPASRCAVDIRLQTTTGQHELIGKVYAKDRSHVYRAMKNFSNSGFGPEHEFSIPQPLAFVPKLQLLLQERVQGNAVTKMLAEGDEAERATAIERCAHWLAHFHRHAKPLGTVFIPNYELMERWQHNVKQRESPLAAKVELLLQRLQVAGSAVDCTEMCASHGDFSHRQIILAGSRTVVFDWDSYCVAHPARDVAKFTLKLQQLAQKVFGARGALSGSIDLFHATYAAASKFTVTKHLPFYKAVHCLKHAKFDSPKIHKTEALLDEGLRILAEEM